jgi:hypothetical protein
LDAWLAAVRASIAGTSRHPALAHDLSDSPAPHWGLKVLKKKERSSHAFEK